MKPVTLSSAVRAGQTRADVDHHVQRRRLRLKGAVVASALVILIVGSWFQRIAWAVAGILICLCIAWFGRVTYVWRRTGDAAEEFLAHANCPNCLKLIGVDSAKRARTGVTLRSLRSHLPPPSTGPGEDLFGAWVVHCPHCMAELLYSPKSHDLHFFRREV